MPLDGECAIWKRNLKIPGLIGSNADFRYGSSTADHGDERAAGRPTLKVGHYAFLAESRCHSLTHRYNYPDPLLRVYRARCKCIDRNNEGNLSSHNPHRAA